jgi:tetratricopeptide (TPR) repeat protein
LCQPPAQFPFLATSTAGDIVENHSSDAIVDLDSVTKSVAETDRRRALVEEELSQAQSIVESLKARSISLRDSVLELQHQLDVTKKAKADEDVALAQTAAKRRKAIEELMSLTALVDELRVTSELQAAAIGVNLDGARAQLDTVEASVAKATSEAGTVEGTLGQLRQTIAGARTHADALESQLSTVEQTTASVVGVANETRGHLEDARAALDIAIGRKRETDAACKTLESLGATLHTKSDEAVAAMRTMETLMAEHDQQTTVLAARVNAVGKLVGSAEPVEDKTPAKAPPQTPTAPAAPVDERYADAVRAVAMLANEQLISHEEAERLSNALRSGAGEAVLRQTWAHTVGSPTPVAHRLIFAEVLQAVGDIKAAIVYYEQAAMAKISPPVVRYLGGLAYLKMDLLDRSTRVAQMLSRDRGGKLLAKILDALRLEQTDRPDLAVHALTAAVSGRGFLPWERDEALFQLGRLHERRRDVNAALACYEKLSGESPAKFDVLERIRSLQDQPV